MPRLCACQSCAYYRDSTDFDLGGRGNRSDWDRTWRKAALLSDGLFWRCPSQSDFIMANKRGLGNLTAFLPPNYVFEEGMSRVVIMATQILLPGNTLWVSGRRSIFRPDLHI